MIDEDPIIRGIAVIIWGEAWASHAEEHDCCPLTGRQIENLMPAIPEQAWRLAHRIAGRVEQANAMDLSALAQAAAKADNQNDPSADYREQFGNCLAWMALGAGVSWFDDHAEFPLDVPLFDSCILRFLADDQCENEGRVACSDCGYYNDPHSCQCSDCGNMLVATARD